MAPPPLLTGLAFALITLTIAWLAWQARAARAPASSAASPWAPWDSRGWCASEGGGSGGDPSPTFTLAALLELRPSIRVWVLRGGVPERDAEDVVQNVVAGAWKSRHTWPPKGSALSAWVFTITRNHVRNYLALVYVQHETPTAEPLEGAVSDDDPLAAAELHRKASEALAILERLPAHLAAMFTRYELEGDPMSEIAAELGISLSTAWGQLGQARRAVALGVARARARRR